MRRVVATISGQFFRKGKCTGCGGSAERTKTLTADTLESLNAKGEAWGDTDLYHKRCDPMEF